MLSQSERLRSVIDPKVMQTASNLHDQVREIILRVPQRILHRSRTLDARNGMFNSDTNFGYLVVALFLPSSQFLLVRLFFG